MPTTRHRVTLKIVLILAACLALAAPVLRQAQDAVLAQVSAAFGLSWYVVGSGGGQTGGPGHAIAGTIGQPAVGTMSGGDHTLCSGLWCGIPTEYRVFLPLVLRQPHPEHSRRVERLVLRASL